MSGFEGEGEALLNNQNQMLMNAINIGQENIQIADETSDMLDHQNQQLRNADKHLDNISSNADQASSTLSRMTVRAFGNKIVQFAIIGLLIVVILAIVQHTF